MKILGNLFQEISRPIGLIKKTYRERVENYSRLKDSITSTSNVKSAPVPNYVTKKEFEARYRNLIFHQKLVGLFMLYSIIYTASTSTLTAFATSLSIALFFIVNYFAIAYKSYLSRLYFSSWDNRKQRINFTIYDFMKLVMSNIGLLYPCTDINKNKTE